MAADSLVARHHEMPAGGWAWRSAIQAPHYQTDRDVGAASVGEGLLAAYAVTRDARYRRAAVAAGDFLLGVAEPAAGGLRWPDWADPDGSRSTTHFTSFDDGAAGISDFLWKLVTRHAQTPLPGGRARGHALGRRAGGGLVMPRDGVYVALDGRSVLARRLLRRRYGSGRHRPRARRVRRSHREPDLPRVCARGRRPASAADRQWSAPAAARVGGPDLETGFLSGSAGVAYMFLERYAHDRDPADRATARRLLRWVNDQAIADDSGGLYWPISRGSDACRRGSSWALPALRGSTCGPLAPRRPRVPRRRPPSGRVAPVRRAAGPAWAELPGDATVPVRVGLDSGAAGIGWVLDDLARAGLDPEANRAIARSALAGSAPARRAPVAGRSGTRAGSSEPPPAPRRALLALGLRRNRRLRRTARRMVGAGPGRSERPLTHHHRRIAVPSRVRSLASVTSRNSSPEMGARRERRNQTADGAFRTAAPGVPRSA